MSVLYALDLLGTAAFAASGALVGVHRRMDMLGVVVLGIVTATGGGTLRDILLGDLPPFCFKDETYLYLSIIVSLLIFFFHHALDWMHRPLAYFDALGLGTFLVIGTGKALAMNSGFVVAVAMGVMTATAGGATRDVLSNQVPLILQKEIYATACIFGGILFYFLDRVGVSENITYILSTLAVVVIRVLAIHHKWSLPLADGRPEEM
jgi:uncharacterized membrane protein YeiH